MKLEDTEKARDWDAMSDLEDDHHHDDGMRYSRKLQLWTDKEQEDGKRQENEQLRTQNLEAREADLETPMPTMPTPGNRYANGPYDSQRKYSEFT